MDKANLPSVEIIESLSLQVLETIPAGVPPPGVQPNFVNPPTYVPVIVGVSSAFFVLATCCLAIRLYTKIWILKRWSWDDVTISLGYAFSTIHFVSVMIGSLHGPIGKHPWDLHLHVFVRKGDLIQSYLTDMMVTPALGLIKLSLFIQYFTIFKILTWVRVCVYLGVCTSGTFYIAVSITGFILNSPWPGESLIRNIFSWHYLKFADFSIPTGVIGMVVDWYLLIIPIPAVLSLSMAWPKKLGVLLVFLTGGLATMASTVNLYYRVQLVKDMSDVTWKVGFFLLWAHIEMYAGITASSMPTLKHFISRQDIFSGPGASLLKTKLNTFLSRLSWGKASIPNLAVQSGNKLGEYRDAFNEVHLASDSYHHHLANTPQAARPHAIRHQNSFITQPNLDHVV